MRRAFTLLELVAAVLILGILASIAVPRFLDSRLVVGDQALRMSLARVRDALEQYAAEHDRRLPQARSGAHLKKLLAPYLPGGFPPVTVGPAAAHPAWAATIKISRVKGEIFGESAPRRGWHYNVRTGQLIINYDQATKFDPARRYDQL